MPDPQPSEPRPWETAEIPEVRYLYPCYGESWHDVSDFNAAALYWWPGDAIWDGDDSDEPGWLCRQCHFERFSYYPDPKTGAHRLKDPPPAISFPDYLAALVTLEQELARRAGLPRCLV